MTQHSAIIRLFTIASVIASPALVSPARAQEAPNARERRAIEVAESLGDAFSSVAARLSDSVVSIRVEMPGRPAGFRGAVPYPFGSDGEQVVRGGGSGVIFHPDGHILTNHHVVGQARRIEVRLHDGRTLPASVVGTDPATDLAVIKVDATGLPAAAFAPRERIRPGEWVVAIGSPFGLDYTVTAGVVSAVGRGGVGMNEIEDYVQTDASINPGNSGGPLVNLRGEVIGINTMIVGRGTGIGFAVVSELAEQVGQQIITGGRVQRAYLGVSFQELAPALAQQMGLPARTRGALIAGVEPGGPADRAGLRAGDVVMAVNDQGLDSSQELFRKVLAAPVGSEMRLTALRDGRRRTVSVQTGVRPRDRATPEDRTPSGDRAASGQPSSADSRSVAGFALQALTRQDARRRGLRYGVLVRQVGPRSAAARAGIEPGDVIVEADRRPVRRPTDVESALRDGRALLHLRRGSGALFVPLRIR